jgi:heme/copper-type cytochrome/quinol oxidase subunit 3
MLFGASMLGYLVIRYTSPKAPAAGWMHLPLGLWASTVLLIASGVTIHAAHRAGRRGDIARMRSGVYSTFVLAIAFITVQAPCLVSLVRAHAMAATQNIGLYGLAFTLILIHAAHVLGGLVPLGWLIRKDRRGLLTLADSPTVRSTALYWHFLDGVWLFMFGTFLLAG